MIGDPTPPILRLLLRCGHRVGDPQLLGGCGAAEVSGAEHELDPGPRIGAERYAELERLVYEVGAPRLAPAAGVEARTRDLIRHHKKKPKR